ncbi:hypothetical protein I6I27_10705 (plasmid) [Staphylococcus pasteuri]|uniref:DUF5906 domain-containing protein n=1 Tax=Staphylococcus warneri TaxID=1292 RepID=UPI001A59BA26|nr:DUF5906 domain-containing protein [Staphylococcus warneri]MBL3399596.1 hypothetical protein [Staphylococcus pasteuri]MBL3399613.1 hypothetical protein [Staphylococcus pasteuri]MCI2768048.1 DUF5906 domain-containing protein [Staphylococcus warneri]MCI2772758.1 DUF5906 domain-containing protein [Staphylococcus warneri]MCI2785329.1 DUF5906 domain-containing protein [Staphylococcus warneri]
MVKSINEIKPNEEKLKKAENKNVPFPEVEAEKDKFESDNRFYLSDSESLKELELNFRQIIEINSDEKANPNTIIEFLNKIKSKFGVVLTSPKDTSFLTDSEQFSFEKNLNMREMSKYNKAILRMYIHLILLNRKAVRFNQSESIFDLRDIYHLDGIHDKMFDVVSDIPENIVGRMNIMVRKKQNAVRDFEKKLISLERQIQFKQNQLSSLSAEDSEDNKDIEKKGEQIQRDINSIINKIEKLSFETVDALEDSSFMKAPTVGMANEFISKFMNFGIKLEQDVENHITTDKEIIAGINNDDLYFQKEDYTWEKGINVYRSILAKIIPSLRLNESDVNQGYDALITMIQSSDKVSVFTFKKNCLFFKNGLIDLTYNDDGSINHQFIHKNELTRQQLMFEYATNYRLNLNYNPQAKTVFDDNKVKEPVTPDYIFGALGLRGFEHDEDEAKARANLLMQYTLKILLPFDDPEIVNDTFLYFYNASNSGKSTYMNLMYNIISAQSTVSLQPKDFSSKESFGLVNVKDKRLVLIDEATDGHHKIETENIKKITTKEPIDANEKNKSYVSFKPTAEMVFASNYEPVFNDESGGTERRLLAFQLDNGYNGLDGRHDLTFIRKVLIKQPEFQSACIKWILDNVNLNQEIPKSVKDDALDLISQEDDVQMFIKKRIQNVIDEPLFIHIDHLYELYRLENFAKGRKANAIRNKSNFKKALVKIRKGVYQIKRLDHSSLDAINKTLYIQGVLFENYYNNLNNNDLTNNTHVKFKDFCEERKQLLNDFYKQTIEVTNKTLSLSLVSRKRSTMIAILPNSEVYDTAVSESDLNDIAKEQKNAFLKSVLSNDNTIEKIKTNDFSKLPFPINNKVSDHFAHYSNDTAINDKENFNEFIKY